MICISKLTMLVHNRPESGFGSILRANRRGSRHCRVTATYCRDASGYECNATTLARKLSVAYRRQFRWRMLNVCPMVATRLLS
jgi:hypothetical protein